VKTADKSFQASFASPRIGNPAFATAISNQDNRNRRDGTPFGRNFRVIHRGDYIPAFPYRSFPLPVLGNLYQQTEPHFFLDVDTGTIPTPANLLAVPGPDNRVDASIAKLIAGAPAHGWFFNGISFCETLPRNLAVTFSMDNPEFKEQVEAFENSFTTHNITLQ
jgi:hypothetical protein